MALNDLGLPIAVAPHRHRVVEPELLDAGAYLVDLLAGVPLGVPGVGDQPIGRLLGYLQLWLLLHAALLPLMFPIREDPPGVTGHHAKKAAAVATA